MPNVFGGTSTDNIAPKFTGYYPDEFEQEALNTINQERAEWDDESVYLTEKISYLMRNVIKKARKFYYGIFDSPQDETTGADKTWIPLTEWSVESVVKSVDLDTKDVLIQPGTPDSTQVVALVRAALLMYMKKMGFGQLLNDLIRAMARDGTVVVKTYECVDKRTGKKMIKSKIVDLLNIWIDPGVDSIQEAPAIIERSLMTQADMEDYSEVWENIDAASFSTIAPNVLDTFGSRRGKVPYLEVWERWGKIKKSWVTKNHNDDDKWAEGHIVASGNRGAGVIHIIRENPRADGLKPYEEGWYKRVDGRWFGRGIAEMLFGLQEYSNEIVNTRKTNNRVLQNGIFLIRKGSGLTPDMMSSMVAGGGLPVTDINRDVKQLQTNDYRQSSYTDEDRVNLYSDRVTGAFDINRGEAGRASASATATLTQDRNIRDTFVLIQEGIGMMIERLIVNQYIPTIQNIMKSGDIIRITGEAKALEAIDEAIIDNRVDAWERDYIENSGFLPTEGEKADFMAQQKKVLSKQGSNRFASYFKKIFDRDIDVEVHLTDEKFNRVVAVQQLRDMLISFSRLPVASRLDSDAIFNEILNLMGLRGNFFLKEAQVPALSGQASQAGRLLKQLPRGMPTEGTAMENAAGMPQIGGMSPQISGGIEGGLPRGLVTPPTQ
jgi:hypothetical protein